MRKILLLIGLICVIPLGYAKKVKFSVDMTGQTISANGVHVVGDFQTIAGFSGGDWNASTCVMLPENGTDIYTITVELPAFRKYEYKFVNGDQFYEAEFVPTASRIGYDFNDNRWLYVDSLDADTFETHPILFAGNAPMNQIMMRFSVNMKGVPVSDSGIHVAGSFNQNNYKTQRLCNLYLNTYETIVYGDTAIHNYIFVNGNSAQDEEIVPGSCAVNSKREIKVSGDTSIATVCFSSCDFCNQTSVGNILTTANNLKVYPNPALDVFELSYSDRQTGDQLILTDMLGKELLTQIIEADTQIVDISNIQKGVMLVKVLSENGQLRTIRLIKL